MKSSKTNTKSTPKPSASSTIKSPNSPSPYKKGVYSGDQNEPNVPEIPKTNA